MRSIRCVELTGKAKHITSFVGAQIDIANAFGFKIPDGCAPEIHLPEEGRIASRLPD